MFLCETKYLFALATGKSFDKPRHYVPEVTIDWFLTDLCKDQCEGCIAAVLGCVLGTNGPYLGVLGMCYVNTCLCLRVEDKAILYENARSETLQTYSRFYTHWWAKRAEQSPGLMRRNERWHEIQTSASRVSNPVPAVCVSSHTTSCVRAVMTTACR